MANRQSGDIIENSPLISEEHYQPVSLNLSRSALFFRVILFQFKLFADGIRDLLLSPLSIIAALVGLVSGHKNPHLMFDRLLRMGQKSDRWINLFDNYSSQPGKSGHHTMDDLVHRFEETMKKDYRENGLSAKTDRKSVV